MICWLPQELWCTYNKVRCLLLFFRKSFFQHPNLSLQVWQLRRWNFHRTSSLSGNPKTRSCQSQKLCRKAIWLTKSCCRRRSTLFLACLQFCSLTCSMAGSEAIICGDTRWCEVKPLSLSKKSLVYKTRTETKAIRDNEIQVKGSCLPKNASDNLPRDRLVISNILFFRRLTSAEIRENRKHTTRDVSVAKTLPQITCIKDFRHRTQRDKLVLLFVFLRCKSFAF